MNPILYIPVALIYLQCIINFHYSSMTFTVVSVFTGPFLDLEVLSSSHDYNYRVCVGYFNNIHLQVLHLFPASPMHCPGQLHLIFDLTQMSSGYHLFIKCFSTLTTAVSKSSNLFLCLGYPATVMLFLYLMLNPYSPYFSFLSTTGRLRHHMCFSVCFLICEDPQTFLTAQSLEPACWYSSFSCTFMNQRNAVFISNRTTTIATVVWA